MSKTKGFRAQHDDLLKVVTEISTHLNVNELSNDATEVRRLLSLLFGKLNVHLSMEDNALYPKLLEHSDERVKSMAKRYMDEMGGVGKAVNAYKDKWSTASLIQKNPSGFIEQTKGIFDALAKRITKENNELYKPVDEL